MYFKNMPNIVYKFNDKQILVKDIFRRIQLSTEAKDRRQLINYIIEDGETPDAVAYNFYGSSEMHWLILLVNEIFSVKEEWPIHQQDLFRYTESKYGVGNASDVHHYALSEDTNIIVDYNASDLANGVIEEVTNYAYEESLNDDKRQIFLLRNEYVQQFTMQYKKLIQA